MLSELKFVQGAIARKELFSPALTHFHLYKGRLLGYNGAMALSCPIDVDLVCSPKATQFIKAIQTCRDETVQLNLNDKGRLVVRSGGFTAHVDCIEEAFPSVAPEGEEVTLAGGVLEALRDVSPFVGEDASRPWARGVLLRGSSAFATNNVIAVERWLGYSFPVEVNLPDEAVTELLRIGAEPVRIQLGENSATFHFAGDRWLRTQLLSTKWPEVQKILDVPNNPSPTPRGIFTALADIYPFRDELGRVFFHTDKVSTSQEEGSGASIEVPGVPASPCFNIQHFMKLDGLIDTIDLSSYPNPCIFYGVKFRGAIVGMKY